MKQLTRNQYDCLKLIGDAGKDGLPRKRLNSIFTDRGSKLMSAYANASITLRAIRPMVVSSKGDGMRLRLSTKGKKVHARISSGKLERPVVWGRNGVSALALPLLKRGNMSQSAVARECGCSRSLVSRINQKLQRLQGAV